MGDLQEIRRKLAAIRGLVRELEADLAALERERAGVLPEERQVVRPRAVVPGVEDLRAVYSSLYGEFLASGPQVVERFVMESEAEYLAAFCRANRVHADVGATPRRRLAVLIVRQMAERRGTERRARRS